jgi:hypothetical protein
MFGHVTAHKQSVNQAVMFGVFFFSYFLLILYLSIKYFEVHTLFTADLRICAAKVKTNVFLQYLDVVLYFLNTSMTGFNEKFYYFSFIYIMFVLLVSVNKAQVLGSELFSCILFLSALAKSITYVFDVH